MCAASAVSERLAGEGKHAVFWYVQVEFGTHSLSKQLRPATLSLTSALRYLTNCFIVSFNCTWLYCNHKVLSFLVYIQQIQIWTHKWLYCKWKLNFYPFLMYWTCKMTSMGAIQEQETSFPFFFFFFFPCMNLHLSKFFFSSFISHVLPCSL